MLFENFQMYKSRTGIYGIYLFALKLILFFFFTCKVTLTTDY